MGKPRLRPFMGVDGEGGGKNRQGQQHYLLMGAGGGEGEQPAAKETGRHLSTIECFEWICSLPPEPLLVGFSFGYDASQIIRDLDAERLARVFEDKQMGDGKSRYTYFGDYGVEYLPKNYLRVCRLRRLLLPSGPNGQMIEHTTREPDSARTIYETFGFFQCSFLKALQMFDVGREHWELIERNKAARDGFTKITAEIRHYNALECDLLAQLMERFRATCHGVDIRPKQWSGAGKIAAAEHASHATLTALDRTDKAGTAIPGVESLVPLAALRLAADAYYGGRFEVTRTGDIDGPIYEYDIGSAYPSAMLSLPCLAHATWEAFEGRPPIVSPSGGATAYVAHVKFNHPAGLPLCGLPIRKKDGRLFWPRQGQGVYWSVEIDAARKIGASVETVSGWACRVTCDCQPFQWVRERYEQRRQLGKDAAGYPIKIALASLYGKMAQRIGTPRWGNLVWAGLITATTRAWLLDAASEAPDDVLMFATDAVFSRSALARLDIGPGLGQWEAEEHKRLFIVQPGIYWGAKRPKTRGVPVSLFTEHTDRFEHTWRLWCGTVGPLGAGPPECGFKVRLFTGARLAFAWGKLERSCRWTAEPRKWSFDWSRKRDPAPLWESATCVRSRPAAGSADLISVPHKANEASYLLDLERLLFEEQQDHVDLTPP